MNLLGTNAADILIVDDTTANLNVLSTMLSQRGYRVRAAINGEMALKSARKTPPDLILLDISMPGMNGYEVCSELKADAQTRHIPIIFVSALDSVSDKVKAFQVGGVDYISKPYQLEEVLVRVQNQLTLFRQRQEIEMLREKDRLYFEELSRTKDHFVSMASHDLKNPLSVVMGYVGLLEECQPIREDPIARQYLERIQFGAENMLRLITDLLDLARIETGLSLTLGTLPFMAYLRACMAELEMQARAKQIALSFSTPDSEFVMLIDESKIRQVLNNLLSNALKYTPSGGRVELSAARESEQVHIRVADTGLGIPAQDLPHIFDKFYRVRREDHMAVEGTGLGLSIAKAIVEQHQGKIWVESELGVGTTMHVVLPLSTQPAG
jgi:two-component system, sensor histidine kinase and response regulator